MNLRTNWHRTLLVIAITFFVSALAVQLTAQDVPKPRAGLWEHFSTSIMNGKPYSSKTATCLDEAMAARNVKLGADMAPGASGTNCKLSPRVLEGKRFKQTTECKIGNSTQRIVTFTTYLSDTAYLSESRATHEPPFMNMKDMTMTLEGKHVGPCPANMRAGDVMQDGKIVMNTLTNPDVPKMDTAADLVKSLDDSAELMAKMHEDVQKLEAAELKREAASPGGQRGVANILATIADVATGVRGKDGLLSRKGQITGAALSALATFTVSDDDVIRMANAATKIYDGENVLLPETDVYSKRLAKLTKSFTRYDGLNLNFGVYKSNTVNAFAMANGTVRFYTGLMDLMNDDELRFILGHEIGHVKKGHTAAGVRAEFAASALSRGAAAAAMKDKNGEVIVNLAGNSLKNVFNKVLTRSYNRAQELESDAYGVEFMKQNRIPPAAAASALRKLARGKASETTLLSTHPAPLERAEIVAKAAR
jgi:metalloprotease